MNDKKAFSLIEILVLLIIIGILASVALPNYTKTKEHVFDKEAIANLKLIQAAEKIYKMEIGNFYGPAPDPQIQSINENLKLSLPVGANRNWNYAVSSVGSCQATRNVSGRTRTWSLPILEEEPTCSGTGCP